MPISEVTNILSLMAKSQKACDDACKNYPRLKVRTDVASKTVGTQPPMIRHCVWDNADVCDALGTLGAQSVTAHHAILRETVRVCKQSVRLDTLILSLKLTLTGIAIGAMITVGVSPMGLAIKAALVGGLVVVLVVQVVFLLDGIGESQRLHKTLRAAVEGQRAFAQSFERLQDAQCYFKEAERLQGKLKFDAAKADEPYA